MCDRVCKEQLVQFLMKVDNDFQTPISKNIGLEEFADKLLGAGTICVAKKEDAIVGIVAGYTDNVVNNMAYISIVAVDPTEYRKGIASKLIQQFIAVCESKKLEGIHVYTVNTNAYWMYRKNGFVDYLLENTPNDTQKHHLAYWFKNDELIIQEIESEDIKEIQDCRNKLFMLREDLIPFSFGGNKVRIAKMYFDDMEKRHCDVIIGYGNTRSNMCRAIANIACGKGLDCIIVCPSGEDGSYVRTNNSTIIEKCGAKVVYCTKKNVADTITSITDSLIQKGKKPYYVNGNCFGEGNEAVPVRAYKKVYDQLYGQFDYIFLACGTGMTVAGLEAGRQLSGGKEKIVAISVARDKDRAQLALEKYLSAYLEREGSEVIVTDKYLCGGYGQYDEKVDRVINDMLCKKGIPLDYTYTGKAFAGMLDYLYENNISEKKILFIHTGGTPLFFDWLKQSGVLQENKGGLDS